MSKARPTRRSERIFRVFARYAARYFRKHMHALRLARWGHPPQGTEGQPLVVYTNHPGWWDAMVYILLSDRLFPEMHAHAPMDAAMLERYPIFRRLGAFPVQPNSPAGAAAFLKETRELLTNPSALLFVSAPGRFVDVRARPQGIKAGVSRVPELAPDSLLVPLAIDFVFWEERKAEVLVAFGESLSARELAKLSRSERRERLENTLHTTMDHLQQDAIARDPALFDSLLVSSSGVGGIYDFWYRLRAGLRGRRYDPNHRGGVQ
jgi:1-acyl-sn-glycerol-3-phosphate acyltransferase